MKGILRSAFDTVFGGTKEPKTTTRFQMINGWRNVFVPMEDYSKDILIKTCIDRVATHVAKLHPNHVVMKKGKKQPAKDSQLQTLLALSPNPYMNAYSFLYNLATKAIANKNAFAYIKRDRQRNVISLWPMEYQSCEAREDDHGNLYIMFRYGGTHSTRTIPYTDLIHLRNMFQQGEIFADTDDNLATHMAMLTKLEQSFDNVVENSGRIRGIAKIAGQAGTEAWKSKAKMLNENLKDPAQGGMVVTDGTMEFTPVDSEPKAADTGQLEFVRDTIYHYFGVSKPIAEGVYDETAWSAFFESVIEPFSIQMSQEFTRKLFTPAEISAGNEIVFDANRLTYASTDTKVELIRQLRPLGILTTNQSLEIMNLPPIADGDDRVQTLNVANTDIVSQYQLNQANDPPKGGEKDEGTTDNPED